MKLFEQAIGKFRKLAEATGSYFTHPGANSGKDLTRAQDIASHMAKNKPKSFDLMKSHGIYRNQALHIAAFPKTGELGSPEHVKHIYTGLRKQPGWWKD